MNELKEVSDSSKGLLFHHWDADGLASSSILLNQIDSPIITFTPIIGNYFIDDQDKIEIRNIDPDYVVVTDMALPEKSIEFLKKFGKVIIFDHHLQDKHDVFYHHNPVIDGQSPKKYPSASWVVNDYIDKDHDFLSILGAFGDREDKLKENDYAMETVEKVIKDLDSTFDDILECAYRLDTLYKMGKRDEITNMPFKLSDFIHPDDVLNLKDLEKNQDILDKAIQDEINSDLEELKDGVYLREMESSYNIISTVTRRLAWSRDEDIVMVVNCEYIQDSCQIYIRGPIPNSENIIEKMKKEGYSAGGKSDVVGMVIPSSDKEEVLNKILKML